MTPVVVVLVALLALGALGAVIVLVVGRLVRHWSRTREQSNVVFAVQMELIAVVQAAVQRSEGRAGDGQVAGAASEAEWASIDTKARAAVRKNVGLLQDARLRQLTVELLDCTGRLNVARDATEVARMRKELSTLQEGFRRRSNEVVRDLRLRR